MPTNSSEKDVSKVPFELLLEGQKNLKPAVKETELKQVAKKSSAEMTPTELEFIRAIDTYKRKFNIPFPSWVEILGILKQLGYEKIHTA